MDTNTSFRERVYAAVSRVPQGKVTTYKAIAQRLETRAYRAIGQVLATNRSERVPCHRVIRTDRSIGGYFGSTDRDAVEQKRMRLEAEGVRFSDNKVIREDIIY